jgi:diaminopimelate epimerase
MQIDFFKYQGAGNDFIVLDNFSGRYDKLTVFQFAKLCDRRYGIGGDGLIKINSDKNVDFGIDYYNADGTQSFCGNGARCSVRFVNEFIFKRDSYIFNAIDGIHDAQLEGGDISLEMKDVEHIESGEDDTYILQTGSPHFIKFEKNIKTADMIAFGKSIRYNDAYKENGINVNLVEQISENILNIRTYERGVEDETLSCGTGITAAAIAYAVKNDIFGDSHIFIEAKGGDLEVKFFTEDAKSFNKIRLIGPAEYVFKGEIHV